MGFRKGFSASAILAALLWCAPAAAGLREDVEAWRTAHEGAVVAQLDELVRLKSVAADPAGLNSTAAKLKSLLEARGFRTTLFTASGAPPVVYGLYDVGAKRTVVFYAHYDGQPVTPSQWSGDPFVPVMRDGSPGARNIDWKTVQGRFNPDWRFHGRAAADDKAAIVALLAGFDALKAAGRKPGVNIKLVWEGEEEKGSPHLADMMKAHAADLRADLWLIGDGPLHQSRTPTLYFGARGSMSLEATIYGPVRALHDGHYGNWAPNPAAMAAQLIAQMRAPDGAILIPGFADDARALTPAERTAIARLPKVEDSLRREFGIGGGESAEGLTLSTMRPALNIRGLRSGQVGAEAANAIPVEAAISIDFRLVPGQTPQGVRRKVETFLKAKGWTLVADTPDAAMRAATTRLIRLSWGGGYPALRSDMTSPAAKAAIAAASGKSPVTVLPMMGASVPIYLFDDIFHVPVLGLPITNHDNNQHAANENIRLGNLWDGIATYAAMMGSLDW